MASPHDDTAKVWSEEQDEIIHGTNAKDIEKLDREKGGVSERREWLERWREAGED